MQVMVPLVASSLGDAYVALDRISKVLLAEEIGDDYPIDPESPFGVDMTGDFTWETVGPPSDTPKPKGKGGAGEKKMTPEEEKKKKEEEKKKKAEEKRKKTEEKAKVKRRRHGEVDEKSGVDEEEEETPDDGSPKPFVLRDVKLRVPKGKFVAIVGRVGSGKSSLLQAMAGEMRKLKGEVTFGGDVAYVSQNPWIQVSNSLLSRSSKPSKLIFLGD
jgi:ATP-binding cassette subfamily C (CFTR/MRP) protein 1